MGEFDDRLSRAIQRGQKTNAARRHAEEARARSEDELRRLHMQYRLALAETIETCLDKIANHIPGFQLEKIVGDKGWGAAIRRDDLDLSQPGSRNNLFSRLEIVVRPLSQYFVLDLAAKGTVRNKEVFARNHFEEVDQAEVESFGELVESWVLQYAEMYASQA